VTVPNRLTAIVAALRSAGATEEIIAVAVKAGGEFGDSPPRPNGRQNDTEMSGEAAPIPSNQCWPSGVPYFFFQSGMQMLQQPGEVHFLYLLDHEVRHDGSPSRAI
jgi:hypothetical protein